MMTSTDVDVIIDYTNWRGERRERRIRPIALVFGSNEYHPIAQWLIEAMDIDDNGEGRLRTFALANIHSWRPV